jgi:DNA topoisomerase-2
MVFLVPHNYNNSSMLCVIQDHDGSHIKGLLINFIHSFWPSLLKVPSFMVEFTTPIIRVSIINAVCFIFNLMKKTLSCTYC